MPEKTVTTSAGHQIASFNVIFSVDQQGRDGQSGNDGRDGQNGRAGKDGKNGTSYTGQNGSNGTDATDGTSGSDATDGTDGTSAGDISLTLSGTPDNLVADIEEPRRGLTKLNLDSAAEGIIFLNTSGGDGGQGGRGGHGGSGGRGGRGGHGAQGRSGRNGADAGDGGTGGNGGNGGAGGDGGNGGRGGNAGDGGSIVVKTTDPRLFMLVSARFSGGAAGRGGAAGSAGSGGQAGSYGHHGSAGQATGGNGAKHGKNGRPGKRGIEGQRGAYGKPGIQGTDGTSGRDGSISYMVFNGDSLVEQSSYRYNAAVTSYSVVDATDDSIYEPGEELTISKIAVMNNGGLTLPSGCKVEMMSTDTTESYRESYTLNSLSQGGQVVIPQQFKVQIKDVPSPTKPGPQRMSYSALPRISLLNRTFDESMVPFNFTASYPVEITYHNSREKICRGEDGIAVVKVKNMSSKTYGSTMGTVELIYNLDPHLIPKVQSTQTAEGFYQVRFPIPQIQPGQELEFKVPYIMSKEAEFYSEYSWNAQLSLRGKIVQFETKPVQCCIGFVPGGHSDVMLTIHKGMTRPMFLNWMHLFKNLPVTLSFWDTDYNQGFSSSIDYKVSWVGSCNTVIYPAPAEEINELLGTDLLVSHLKQNEQQTLSSSSPSDAHGMMLITPQQALQVRNYFKHYSTIKKRADDFGGFHIFPPYLSHVKSKIETICKNQPDDDTYSWFDCNLKIEKPTFSLRYNYGELIITKCMVKRDTRLVNMIDETAVLEKFVRQDNNRDARTLSVPDFAMAIALLRALPTDKKFLTISSPSYHQTGINSPVTISGQEEPVQLTMSMAEAAGYALAQDLVIELRSAAKNSYSAIIEQLLLAASTNQRPPVTRTCAEDTGSNIIMVAVIKSLQACLSAKKGKTIISSEKSSQMHKFCSSALSSLKESSMSSQERSMVSTLINKFDTVSSMTDVNIFAPLN